MYIPNGLTWEKSTTLNGGIDIALLNSRLKVSFDKYTRKTTNMFTGDCRFLLCLAPVLPKKLTKRPGNEGLGVIYKLVGSV